MPINNLLTFPFNSYLMVRLDYVVICGDELEAKIMRIIEMYMEDERKIIYKALLNDPRNTIDPQATIEITKDVWPAISHRLFKNDLYDQDMAENTLKRAIKSLKKKRFIKVRDTDLKRYESPSYQIDTIVVQAEFEQIKALGKSGYQKLMVSKIDGIKKSSHQNMTPSEGQNLIPSSASRVSNFDPNSIRDYEKIDYVEESTDASAIAPAAHPPFSSRQEADHFADASKPIPSQQEEAEPIRIATSEQGSRAQEIEDTHATPSPQAPTQQTNVVAQALSGRADAIPAEAQQTPPKPRRTPPVHKEGIPTNEQIENVFVCLEQTICRLTEQADFTYSRTKAAKAAVKDWLTGRPEASQKKLSWHVTTLYHKPKDEKSGFYWREHLSVAAILNNYDREIVNYRNGASASPTPQRPKPMLPPRVPTREEMHLEIV